MKCSSGCRRNEDRKSDNGKLVVHIKTAARAISPPNNKILPGITDAFRQPQLP
jgi:hypothetical protein